MLRYICTVCIYTKLFCILQHQKTCRSCPTSCRQTGLFHFLSVSIFVCLFHFLFLRKCLWYVCKLMYFIRRCMGSQYLYDLLQLCILCKYVSFSAKKAFRTAENSQFSLKSCYALECSFLKYIYLENQHFICPSFNVSF